MKPKMHLTEHAKKRMQQRGISELQTRIIEEFGVEQYQKGGSYLMYLPTKTILDIRHALDKIERVRMVRGDEEKIITTMHQTCKIRATEYAA
jgi:peroxiredoxin